MQVDPNVRKHQIHGLEIAVWEWPGHGPTVLLCHATGFHARCWDQVVARLDGQHCIALDFRGHGRSSKPEPPYHWRLFGEDLAELLWQIGLRDAVGVGHSMGGHSLTLAASKNPGAFRSLILLDPVILPAHAYGRPAEPLDFVLRRKNQWESSDAMFERFKDRVPFRRWDPAVLRDYCDFALNGASLACPPEVEASIYAHSGEDRSNIYAEVSRIECPVQVVRSAESYEYGKFDGSPTATDLATHFQQGVDVHWTDVSHFIPMELPGRTADLILAAVCR